MRARADSQSIDICRIARAVKRTGKTTSQAIAIAVSRVKKWAAGADDVDADTRAKAAKALAEWEKLKAKSKAKDVKATAPGEILCLSAAVKVFNVDAVRKAWNRQSSGTASYSYIKEMWTDHVIVCTHEDMDGESLYRVDYSVTAEGGVTFEQPVPVKTQYVAITEGDLVGAQLSNAELHRLIASVGPCYTSATDRVLLTVGRRPTALEQVLELAEKRR